MEIKIENKDFIKYKNMSDEERILINTHSQLVDVFDDEKGWIPAPDINPNEFKDYCYRLVRDYDNSKLRPLTLHEEIMEAIEGCHTRIIGATQPEESKRAEISHLSTLHSLQFRYFSARIIDKE